jgi:hypothetical protein
VVEPPGSAAVIGLESQTAGTHFNLLRLLSQRHSKLHSLLIT